MSRVIDEEPNGPILTPEEEASLSDKQLFKYSIIRDENTGEIEICPMSKSHRIVFNGTEEVEIFIKLLKEFIVEQ